MGELHLHSRAKNGPDGPEIERKINGSLDYVSQLARKLGSDDPVERHFAPILGRWNSIHDEANRWRTAADTAEHATTELKSHLGRLDAGWQGRDADAFIAYVGEIGLAGFDMADALRAMADVLDTVADGLREIAQQMAELLTDGADDMSAAMAGPVASVANAREHLDDLDQACSELHESAKDVLTAFVRLCDDMQAEQGVGALRLAHPMPTQRLSLPSHQSPVGPGASLPAGADTVRSVKPAAAATSGDGTDLVDGPATLRDVAATLAGEPARDEDRSSIAQPAAGSATVVAASDSGAESSLAQSHAHGADAGSTMPAPGAISGAVEGSVHVAPPSAASSGGQAAAQTAAQGEAGMPMMPMMPMAPGQGGDQEYKSKRKLTGDMTEIFGEPEKTAPPVIGEDPASPPKKKK